MVRAARSFTDWSGSCDSSLSTKSCAALTLRSRSDDSAEARRPRTIRRRALMARGTWVWESDLALGMTQFLVPQNSYSIGEGGLPLLARPSPGGTSYPPGDLQEID